MDALTTANQNQAVAMNSISKATLYIAGTTTSDTYTGPSTIQILTGAGRLASVTLVVAGSDTVKLYDANSISTLPSNGLLYIIPATATAGIIPMGLECSDGIVVVIGAGCTVNVTYSPAR